MPKILDLFATLEHIKEGYSISRFGDGEMHFIFRHKGIKTQQHNKKLEKRLLAIITYKQPLPKHLACIPDFFDPGKRTIPYGSKFFRPKRWKRIAKIYSHEIPESENQYGSSFVFRPELFAIDYTAYFKLVQDIFADKKFVVVGNPHPAFKAFTEEARMQVVQKIDTPATNAYSSYSTILTKCRKINKAVSGDLIFLISTGASAKVLAYDLCSLGIQALDAGNFFKIFHWHQKGIL